MFVSLKYRYRQESDLIFIAINLFILRKFCSESSEKREKKNPRNNEPKCNRWRLNVDETSEPEQPPFLQIK